MIIIAEKINGSIPSVAKAIAEKDEAFLRDLAVRQSEAGATYIDVCSSVAPEVEFDTMRWMLDLVQDATDTPISVDSPNAECLVQLLPYVKKPGLVNSVSGEGNKIDLVFPAIADTKWEVMALLSDDTGIPKSAADRLRVFDKIMAEAEKYGIAPNRIHIDPLVEMLCTSEDGIAMVIEVITSIKKRYPTIHISGAVSNISFNLPARKLVNIGFVVLAMNAGMDSAIFDPLDKQLLGVIYATEALLGMDDFCMEYITAFREERIAAVNKKK
ncbi:MAG: methyltetrahydrofolate cobalamin methyltransferase [Oscillospiraceae bacterium]|jgi:5-methyltetrahydrofolate--homocysteine methyltransferase|nr:methyltetrahydrofolate cobalamin methyltransferase [Oscillospiraceae bacterium]